MQTPEEGRIGFGGWLVLLWGLGGVLTLLSSAVFRLWPVVVSSFPAKFEFVHWLGYSVSVAFMAYSEGYKGFQKAYSPRVVRRGFYLARNPRFGLAVVAPLFCMGLVHASKKRQRVSWIVLGGVCVLIVMVRQVPQPWRGIVDAGVIAGLTWGIFFIVYFFFRACRGIAPPASLDLPCGEA